MLLLKHPYLIDANLVIKMPTKIWESLRTLNGSHIDQEFIKVQEKSGRNTSFPPLRIAYINGSGFL